MPDSFIKQVDISATETPDLHEIAGKYIQEINTKSTISGLKTWADILELMETSFELVPLAELPTIPTDTQAHKDEFYAQWRNKIVAIPNGGTDPNVRDEYVIVKSGTDPNWNYSWELFGTTAVDISGKVDTGTYTTEAASGNTGEGGAQVITVSATLNATGSTVIEYVKATGIQNAGSTATANTGEAGGHTIQGSNFSFTGTKKTLTQSISYTPEGSVEVQAVGAHSHTLNVTGLTAANTVSVVTEVAAAALQTGTGYTDTFNTDAIKSVTLKTGEGYASEFNTDAIKDAELTGTTTFVTNALKSAEFKTADASTTYTIPYVSAVSATTLGGDVTLVKTVSGQTATVVSSVTKATSNFVSNATVESNVLKFNLAAAVSSMTVSTTTGLTGVTSTSGTVTINSGTVTKKYMGLTTTAAGAGDKASVGITTTAASKASVGLTTTAASTKKVGVTGGTVTGTTTVIKSLPAMTISEISAETITGTFTGTAKTIDVSIEYTPQGTIGGSQTVAAHSHTYVELKEHTHTLNTATASISVNISVPIDHDHTINVSNHTHSLGNHTHDINLQNSNS